MLAYVFSPHGKIAHTHTHIHTQSKTKQNQKKKERAENRTLSEVNHSF